MTLASGPAAGRSGAVLVTGAARRIGRAIAHDLAAAGWSVAVHYNTSAAQADQLVAELADNGGIAAAVQADLEVEGEVRTLIPRAVERLGPLTGLVNNASRFEPDDLATLSRAGWDLHLDTNLFAPALLAQAFVRQLPDGLAGAIVNLLDTMAMRPGPGFLSYTVSKVALAGLTQSLALALAPQVRVNGVAPGVVLPAPRQSAEHFNRMAAHLPLARPSPPEDIAAAVRFALETASMTGQVLAVDGGGALVGPDLG